MHVLLFFSKLVFNNNFVDTGKISRFNDKVLSVLTGVRGLFKMADK